MKQVTVIAHRGASGDFPENTAAAFLEAINLGVEMIEFDVQLTRDHRLVIIHDDTVDRTSNGSGQVAGMTLAQIKQLDAGSWFAERFADERFLTLTETLDLAPAQMRLNVHFKASAQNSDVLAPLVVQELVRHNRMGTAFVTGSEATVLAARCIDPDLEICTNLSVTRCVAIGCRILQPSNKTTVPDLVEEAHRHGMEINAFYADDAAEIERLIDCGVDGILTNFPKRMQGLFS